MWWGSNNKDYGNIQKLKRKIDEGLLVESDIKSFQKSQREMNTIFVNSNLLKMKDMNKNIHLKKTYWFIFRIGEVKVYVEEVWWNTSIEQKRKISW